MTTQGIGTNVVTQIAIVVKDIDKVSEAWSKVFGLPKPTPIIAGGEDANAVYRGKPTNAQAKLAFFNLGQVALELIDRSG